MELLFSWEKSTLFSSETDLFSGEKSIAISGTQDCYRGKTVMLSRENSFVSPRKPYPYLYTVTEVMDGPH